MRAAEYACVSVEKVYTQFQSSDRGLSETAARETLNTYGSNKITTNSHSSWRNILLRQFQSPFLYLLFAAAAIAAFLGEFLDAGLIVLFVLMNGTIGFFQEYRSEQTVQLLEKYVKKTARVIRGGTEIIIDALQVVPGDLLVLKPGDILPADVRFITVESLVIDESVLTGESKAVEKNPATLSKKPVSYYDASNLGFAGTTVVRGEGTAIVVATGNATNLGEISALTGETKRLSTYQQGIARFSTFILWIIVLTLGIVLLLQFILKGTSDLPNLLIFAVALAVSVIPEALPIITTFSLSHGALRLSKHKVVVKRLTAIEDLGSIEVLCTDKTGTITENSLTVIEERSHAGQDVRMYAAMGADLQAVSEHAGDPFDTAILAALGKKQQLHVKVVRQADMLPFDPVRRRNSVLVEDSGDFILVVRGAPEELIDRCIGISEPDREEYRQWLAEQGTNGRRTLGVAIKHLKKPTTLAPEIEDRLEYIGCLAFNDPLKPTAKDAIQRAKSLGVQVKIITGDSREVACAVGKEVGLIQDETTQVVTGDEFDAAPARRQLEMVEHGTVFARISPRQKYDIISLIRKKNHVGFLGEGINDAPALKVANVGIVVNGASDVAREASDIILLHRSLRVIIDGIQLGRETFANTNKYIKATLSSNIGNFYTVAISSLFIPFLPMLPLQILLINLLTDFPMIAIATDRTEKEELHNPRTYDVKEVALFAVALGFVSTVFDFIFFALFSRGEPSMLQTNWFIGSALTELVFLYVVRSRRPVWKSLRPSATIIWLTILAAGTAVALPFTVVGTGLFGFRTPPGEELLLIGAVTGAFFVSSEVVKALYYRFVVVAANR